VSKRYLEALSEFDLDPRRVSPERAAQWFLTRPDEVQFRITMAFDAWLSQLCDPMCRGLPYREWVLAVLAEIDPNPQRTAIRKVVETGDQTALSEIAEDSSLLSNSPAFIWLVAGRLENLDQSLELLQTARARYPGSLLLNQKLGERLMLNRMGHVAIDAFIAALAIKPDALTNVHAAHILADQDREREAIVMFRNAIRLDPKCTVAYSRLAHVLVHQNDERAALAVTDAALAHIDPDDPQRWQCYLVRGEACEKLQQPAEALAAYRMVLEQDSLPPQVEEEVGSHMRELEASAP